MKVEEKIFGNVEFSNISTKTNFLNCSVFMHCVTTFKFISYDIF